MADDLPQLDDETEKRIRSGNPDLLQALSLTPVLKGGDRLIAEGIASNRHAVVAGILYKHPGVLAQKYGQEQFDAWVGQLLEKSDRVGVHLSIAEVALYQNNPRQFQSAAERLAVSCETITYVTRANAVTVMRVVLALQHASMNERWCKMIRQAGATEVAFHSCEAVIKSVSARSRGELSPEVVARALYFPYGLNYFLTIRRWERIADLHLIKTGIAIPASFMAMRGSVPNSSRDDQLAGILALMGFAP